MLQTGLIVGHARRSKMERIMPTHFELVADVLSEVCVDGVQALIFKTGRCPVTFWANAACTSYIVIN